jgi:hypothetical protein
VRSADKHKGAGQGTVVRTRDLPQAIWLCPSPWGHAEEFYVPHGGVCPAAGCRETLVPYHRDERQAEKMPDGAEGGRVAPDARGTAEGQRAGSSRPSLGEDDGLCICGRQVRRDPHSCAHELRAEVDRLRNALDRLVSDVEDCGSPRRLAGALIRAYAVLDERET